MSSFREHCFETRDHSAHDRFTGCPILAAEIVERLLEKRERVDVVAIHLDDRKRRFGPKLGTVSVATDHRAEPGRPFDRFFP